MNTSANDSSKDEANPDKNELQSDSTHCGTEARQERAAGPRNNVAKRTGGAPTNREQRGVDESATLVNDSTGDNNGPAAGLRNNVAKRTGGAPTNRESRDGKSSPVLCANSTTTDSQTGMDDV